LLKSCTQLSQLLGNSQRPWMKTTGVLPEAFAASISGSPARKLMPCRTRLGRGDRDVRDHVHGLFHLEGGLLPLLYPFILDPVGYVDRGSLVPVKLIECIGKGGGDFSADLLSNPSAWISRAQRPYSAGTV
jgi:hypothetical protein